MGFLGAVTLIKSYMLIPPESDYDLAAQKLVEADNEIDRRLKIMGNTGYWMLDDNSVRFQFPVGFSGLERVLLLRSTYARLSPLNDPSSMQRFHCHDDLYYPGKDILLETFIRTLLQESPGPCCSILEAWAISYIYGILMVEDTILDSCDDESVRLWFNKKIRRGKG
ncbi:hypothetical protein BKA66DRAFT_510863 [Pyrenochaeta sp. MPI-SDFR-AT-0127]|nr:hypothetical protein BKA66DRAFT_510863 [Pyrenochaeta sp. MPI-SDFR-AT-0127]